MGVYSVMPYYARIYRELFIIKYYVLRGMCAEVVQLSLADSYDGFASLWRGPW